MVLITIVTGAYKPTNISWGPHIVPLVNPSSPTELKLLFSCGRLEAARSKRRSSRGSLNQADLWEGSRSGRFRSFLGQKGAPPSDGYVGL